MVFTAVLTAAADPAAGQESLPSFLNSGDTSVRTWDVDSADLPQEDWLKWIAQSSGSKSKSWWPSWSMPKPFGQKSLGPSSYAKNKKSTWQKMSQTSKRMWRKTAEILDPYPPPKPETASKPKSGGNWLTGWMKPKEEKKIESVTDWLHQPTIK